MSLDLQKCIHALRRSFTQIGPMWIGELPRPTVAPAPTPPALEGRGDPECSAGDVTA